MPLPTMYVRPYYLLDARFCFSFFKCGLMHVDGRMHQAGLSETQITSKFMLFREGSSGIIGY